MELRLTTDDLSTSAKKIKKDIKKNNPSADISHNKILDILSLNILNKSYQSAQENCNSRIEFDYLSLWNVKKKILNDFKNIGFEITNVFYLDEVFKKHRDSFSSEFHDYSIAQYIQHYEFLNDKELYDKEIVTYEDAYDVAEIFVIELVDKYKTFNAYRSKDDFFKQAKNDNIFRKYENFLELKSISNKIFNDESLTQFEELIIEVVFVEDLNLLDSHISNMTKEIKREIVRLRSLKEKKINYEYFVKNITPYNFDININNREVHSLYFTTNNYLKEGSFLMGGKERESTGLIDKIKNIKKEKHELFYIKDEEFDKKPFFISGEHWSGSPYVFISLFHERMLKKEGGFYFNTRIRNNCKRELADFKDIVNTIGQRNKFVFVNGEEIFELTKEKIDKYIKSNRIVYVYLNEYESYINKNKTNKYSKKILEIIDYIGKKEKEKRVNLFVNASDSLINDLNDFAPNHKDYNNVNCLYRTALSDSKFRTNNIENIFIMKAYDGIERYFKNILSSDPESKKETIETVKNLKPGEFIYIKDSYIQNEGMVFKFPYAYTGRDNSNNFYYNENE